MGYSAAELRRMGLGHLAAEMESGSKRTSKYNNSKTEEDGFKFDSQKEYRRYKALKLLERTGQISDLKHHVSFELAPQVRYSTATRAKPALRYEADFTYVENGKLVVEDVKSKDATAKDKVYIIKKHLMMWVHGIEIRET